MFPNLKGVFMLFLKKMVVLLSVVFTYSSYAQVETGNYQESHDVIVSCSQDFVDSIKAIKKQRLIVHGVGVVAGALTAGTLLAGLEIFGITSAFKMNGQKKAFNMLSALNEGDLENEIVVEFFENTNQKLKRKYEITDYTVETMAQQLLEADTTGVICRNRLSPFFPIPRIYSMREMKKYLIKLNTRTEESEEAK
jgi:hypothetical protein